MSREKSKQWTANHEVDEAKVEGPFPHGDRFPVYVKDGKIVAEEFFGHM